MMNAEGSLWTTGQDPVLEYQKLLGTGGGGATVHQVLFLLSSAYHQLRNRRNSMVSAPSSILHLYSRLNEAPILIQAGLRKKSVRPGLQSKTK